jgi:hypothetical protein
MLSAKGPYFLDPTLKKHRLFNHGPPVHVKVGPFQCANVSDYTLANTVCRDNIPVILYEAIKHEDTEVVEEKYAVLAPPHKDLRVVCAGCYKPGLSLFHPGQCVSCRTFATHFETMEGDKDKITQEHLKTRKRPCLNWGPKPHANPNQSFEDETLEEKIARMRDVVISPTDAIEPELALPGTRNLKDVPACDLLHALKGPLGLTTEHTDEILAEITTSDLLYALKRRHPDGLAGFLNHVEDEDIIEYLDNIHLKDINAYVKKKDKASRVKRALKTLR